MRCSTHKLERSSKCKECKELSKRDNARQSSVVKKSSSSGDSWFEFLFDWWD